MRISTSMIYNSGVTSMQQRTSSLLRTQQQISSGRRILSPSDDPVAAARALEVTQSQSINKQYQTSQGYAKNTLSIMDGQLSSMNDLLARVRELTVQAGNAALSDMDRRSIATEMRTRFDELVALANSTDGAGQYLFSGYQGASKPFAGSVDNGVDYLGDDGIRTLQVSSGRQLPTSASGNDTFMRIKNGNGVFVAGIQSAKSANASHVTFEGTAGMTNPPATTGSFELRFWTDTAGTVKTSAQAVGTVNPNAAPAGTGFLPYTFVTGGGAGTDNPISITIDGGAPIIIDFATAAGGPTYNDSNAIVSAIQSAIDAAGAGATVSLDTAGRLVVTSDSSGAPASTLVLADAGGGGNDSMAALFGTPGISNGINGAPGTTYFDLVAANGASLYTRSPSTAGGSGNTYTHVYASGTPLDLSSAGPYAFDYGVLPVFTGMPADGDTFTVDRTNAGIDIVGKTFNAAAARAVVTASAVTNPVKWSQAANSGNLELRFWTDTARTMTPGSAIGLPFNTDIVAGVNDTFDLDLDGLGAIPVTVAAATYTSPAALAGAVQAAIDTATGSPPGPSLATVTLNAASQLVVASNTIGPPSAVAISENNGGFASMFGGSSAVMPAGATTSGSAAGGSPLFTVAAGVNDQFGLSVDNGAWVTVNAVPAGDYSPQNLANVIQLAIDGTAGLGPGMATVAVDALTGKVVVTSTATGAASSIGLGVAPPGNTGFATMFSGAASVAGTVAGGVQTPGYAVAAASPTYPVVIPAAPNNDFLLSIDQMSGGVPVALTPGATYLTPAALKTAVQNAIDAALGSNKATVSLDASNRLVVASNLNGPLSQVTVGATAGTGFAQLFGGGAASTAGTISAVGTIFYDIVDAGTGNSLFTGGTSTTGAGGTYTHAFSSGAPISLSSPLSPAFDFGASVTVAGTPAGGDVFTIKNNTDPVLGNGYFAVAPKTTAAANMGGGIIGTGEVLDPAKWGSPYNSHQLEVRFWKDPADTSANAPVYYDLVDAKTEKSLFTDSISMSGGSGNTYTHVFKSGDNIGFSGLAAPYNDFGVSVTINGTPASGDVFTLDNSTTLSIFDTLADLIHAIESPAGPVGSNSNAELHNKLDKALTGIDAASNNILRVRADVGTRLGEIDDLGAVSSNLDLLYSSTLSDLQDIDYAKAITDLMRTQMELQASQQSFTRVSQLSLFDYL